MVIFLVNIFHDVEVAYRLGRLCEQVTCMTHFFFTGLAGDYCGFPETGLSSCP